MKKYWTIAKSKTQMEFVKRANVLAYIGGNLIDLFIQIVIWTAIFSSASVVSGYTRREMMTYVIIGWVFMYLSTNYGYENYIKNDIHEGKLSNFLIKPINYLTYISSHAVGRAMFAFFIIIGQSVFFLYFFRHELIWDLSPARLAIFILMFFFAYIIKFYLSAIVGFIAFWTMEINGLYYVLNVVNRFLSGAFFPITFLPAIAVKASFSLPFIYTYYVPLQLYLGKISIQEGIRALSIQLFWIFALYIIVKFVFRRGLYKYEGTGM